MKFLVSISDKEFTILAQYIKHNYGINLKDEKRSLVCGRLNNVLIQNGFISFSDYYDYIAADKIGTAISILIDKITTNHTYFMREADHFYYFRDKVLPYMMQTSRSKDLRIWCAGCSTGEEPYTIAMIIDEVLGKEKYLWDTKILATDISGKVLEGAQKGIYSNDRIATLPKSWKTHYFKKYDEENSILIDRIKNEVIYRRFKLISCAS